MVHKARMNINECNPNKFQIIFHSVRRKFRSLLPVSSQKENASKFENQEDCVRLASILRSGFSHSPSFELLLRIALFGNEWP